jgi:hypothetical protein|tara:strand:- start:74905 stop:75609 length:705 start_codon:yes stop_codon:yes gene_type:complete
MEIEQKLPKMPRDGSIDETDGQAVFNWVLNEMKAGTIGWIKFNIISIKPQSFIPLPWHHKGRIETESLWMAHRELFIDNNEVSEYIAKDDEGWRPWEMFPAPEMSAYLNEELPAEYIDHVRYTRMPPKSTTIVNEPDKDLKIENLEEAKLTLLMTLIMPNRGKSVVEVEGFDAFNLKEGVVYFLNPFRKQVLKNNAELDDSTQLEIKVRLGNQCTPFSDVITRSYFQAIGHMQE